MDVRESISMQNEVSMSLAKQVITTVSQGSNVIFSPASINVILSIIAGPPKIRFSLSSNSLSPINSTNSLPISSPLFSLTVALTVVLSYQLLMAFGSISLSPLNLPLRSFWLILTKLLRIKLIFKRRLWK